MANLKQRVRNDPEEETVLTILQNSVSKKRSKARTQVLMKMQEQFRNLFLDPTFKSDYYWNTNLNKKE